MFDEHENVVFSGFFKESLMLLKMLDRWLGDEDVDLTFDGVESDWIMCAVGGKDCDRISR